MEKASLGQTEKAKRVKWLFRLEIGWMQLLECLTIIYQTLIAVLACMDEHATTLLSCRSLTSFWAFLRISWTDFDSLTNRQMTFQTEHVQHVRTDVTWNMVTILTIALTTKTRAQDDYGRLQHANGTGKTKFGLIRQPWQRDSIGRWCH